MALDRGMFRVWVCAAVLWAVWCVWQAIRAWDQTVQSNAAYGFTPKDGFGWELALVYFLIWSVPTLGALALGFIVLRAGRWVIAGFRAS